MTDTSTTPNLADPIYLWTRNNKEAAKSMPEEYVAISGDGRKLLAHSVSSGEVFRSTRDLKGSVFIGKLSYYLKFVG